MNNIEVEIRSFISEERFKSLLEFFKANAKLVKEDYQETFYFDSEQDLRIQKNNFFSKIWMKSGEIHDECRQETEIKVPKEDFEKLEELFIALGYGIKIKWFRERNKFEWDGVTVCLDHTKGYGRIIELEKMCAEDEKQSALELLKKKFDELKIELTPKEDFKNKFKYYEQNWKKLTK